MTRGEHIAEAVRAHLKANGLTQRNLTGAMLAKIADETLRKHSEKRAPKQVVEEMGETLVAELEQTAAFAGVNVRQEYLLCQDWCADKKAKFSRSRFKNWLRRAAKDDLSRAPGGAKLVAALAKNMDLVTEPFGWRITLLRIYPSLDKAAVAAKQWADLSPDTRKDILKATDTREG